MGNIRAGVVLVTKFIRPSASAYAGYIDYIDREEAVRNEYSDKWNGYIDYMGNPEKTSELFGAGTDRLSQTEKLHLKGDFISAKENDNLMWQTVLSFDNRWLEEQGVYDSRTNILNADKVKELTRNSMKKMLEKEGIIDSAVWCASIHYNTDNIHVHIATVEPGITLRPVRDNGEPKGVWKQSTLKAGKASVVNALLLQQEENRLINDIIRKNIVGGKRDKAIAYDKDLRQAFLQVYNNLPADKRYWNYGSTNLGNLTRMHLDELSRLYIQKYHQEDMLQFQTALHKQQEKYEKAYGKGEKVENQYVQNKEKELYKRLGNSILKEMKNYDDEMNRVYGKGYKTLGYNLNKISDNKMFSNQKMRSGLRIMGAAMNRISQSFKKDFQSMKNLTEYEKLQQKIEQKKQEQDVKL